MNNALENDELAAKPIIRIDECTFRAKLLLFYFTIQGRKPSGICSSIVQQLSVFPLVQLFPALECSALIRGIFLTSYFFSSVNLLHSIAVLYQPPPWGFTTTTQLFCCQQEMHYSAVLVLGGDALQSCAVVVGRLI